ncbi:MAG: hypothetical protein D6756_14310 [Cyanobacteria bacterium J083]|nr:MAG: hypothetical protein D6756_14310 [Cyanobacteria bacterium J083]
MYSQTLPIAKSNGFSCFLSPLKKIIQTGNTAQKWLALARKGLTISQILRQEIAFMEEEDKQLETKICADYLVA